MQYPKSLKTIDVDIVKYYPMLFKDYPRLLKEEMCDKFGVPCGWTDRVLKSFNQLEFLNLEYGRKYNQIIQIKYLKEINGNLEYCFAITDFDNILTKFCLYVIKKTFGVNSKLYEWLDDRIHFNKKVNACVDFLIEKTKRIISDCTVDCKRICKNCGVMVGIDEILNLENGFDTYECEEDYKKNNC